MPTSVELLRTHNKLSAQKRIKNHTARWWHKQTCEACRDGHPMDGLGVLLRLVAGMPSPAESAPAADVRKH